MSYILSIETATKSCSIALAKDEQLIDCFEEVSEKYSHSEQLTVFIQDILAKHHLSTKDLEAIAISSGPGSYTGLRMGVSTAKGLCYALDIPLISISTLEAMAQLMVKAGSNPSETIVTSTPLFFLSVSNLNIGFVCARKTGA